MPLKKSFWEPWLKYVSFYFDLASCDPEKNWHIFWKKKKSTVNKYLLLIKIIWRPVPERKSYTKFQWDFQLPKAAQLKRLLAAILRKQI